MKAYIIRHGESNYKQEKAPTLADASDLTPAGIETVLDTAEDMARLINPEIKINLLSSPYARTLETSSLIQKVLSTKGLTLPEIQINECLGEVKNFDWTLFTELLKDRQINPHNQSPIEYFRRDFLHNLSDEVKRSLGSELLQKINNIENYLSCLNRFQGCLDSLEGDSVLVTHEGLTGKYIEMAAGKCNKTPYLGKGKYFVLENQGSEWKPLIVPEGAIQYE